MRVSGHREQSKNIAPEGAMADGLLQDLPRDLPTFLARFGTDEAVSGLSVPGALAGGLSLRRLRPRSGLQLTRSG